MKRVFVMVAASAGLLAAGVAASPSSGAQPSRQAVPLHLTCSSGYVSAIIGGQSKCLRAGEFCSASEETDYERYGFTCVDGHLKSGAPTSSTTATATTTTVATTTAATTTTTPISHTGGGGVALGVTVRLAARTKTSGCARGVLPDRRCSPGAYYSGLTAAVICSGSFRTSTIRNVPQSEKYSVETKYGMSARLYGRTIEIDHIVSLELGGSNDIANLFPEPGSGPANYHVKDKLENAAHAAVCDGKITLSYAQHQIASNWELLYKKLYGVAPTG